MDHYGFTFRAQDTLRTGHLTVALELWPLFSRKFATASALVKSETVFPFSSILCSQLCWLSVAQYLKQSTWMFIFILSLAE